MDKLEKVHPILKAKVLALIDLAQKEGYDLRVVQGLRTVEEQNELYAQGRTKPGKKVTNAKGGQSNHNYGCAVDLGFYVNGQISWEDKFYFNIGRWAAAVGLDWGGNWKTIKDRPHVELPNLPKPAVLLPIYQKGGLKAVWEFIDKSSSTLPKTIGEPPKPQEIGIGAKGEQVKLLQQKLVEKGYLKASDIDGDFGQVTQLALQRFQLANGLIADGICGVKSAEKLGLKY